MIISVFDNLFQPRLEIPNAPVEKNTVHYPSRNIEFGLIIHHIKAGTWEAKIDAVKARKLKKDSLPCFTPSGRFRLRFDAEILEYSQLIVLDYDNVDSVFNAKKRAIESNFTHAAFISPSGKGIKIFVKVNTKAAKHLEAFNQVKKHFDSLLALEADKSGSNISRLCFVSSDRDCFYNINSEPFTVVKTTSTANTIAAEHNLFLNFLIGFTEKNVGKYLKDNRNNFLFLLACNCNRYGLDKDLAKEMLLHVWEYDTEGLPVAEVYKTLSSAYSNIQEHGKFPFPKSLK